MSVSSAVLITRTQDYIAKYNLKVIGVTGSQHVRLVAQAIATLPLQSHVHATPLTNMTDTAAAIMSTSPRGKWWHILVSSRIREMKYAEPKTIILSLKAEKPGDIDSAPAFPFAVAVVTNTHDENLGIFQTTQAVAHEYMSLAAGLPKDGLAVVNIDDPLLAELASHLTCNVITVGQNSAANIQLIRTKRSGVSGFVAEFKIGQHHYEQSFPHLVSSGQLIAPLATLAIAMHNGLDMKKTLAGLHDLTPPTGELNRIAGKNHSIILDESSNATPQSVTNGLKTLNELPQHLSHREEVEPRRIAVIGDLTDLGSKTTAAYEKVGDQLAENVDIVITVGEEIKKAQAQVLKTPSIDTHHFQTSKEAAHWLAPYLKRGDIVFVTGAAHIQMEKAVQILHAQ